MDSYTAKQLAIVDALQVEGNEKLAAKIENHLYKIGRLKKGQKIKLRTGY